MKYLKKRKYLHWFHQGFCSSFTLASKVVERSEEIVTVIMSRINTTLRAIMNIWILLKGTSCYSKDLLFQILRE